jgi:hypothetical protein
LPAKSLPVRTAALLVGSALMDSLSTLAIVEYSLVGHLNIFDHSGPDSNWERVEERDRASCSDISDGRDATLAKQDNKA